jgi:CHAD domain-containing protein
VSTAAAGVAARLAADRERLLSRLATAARRMQRRRDAEASHDVRVTTRRLDALLDVWRGLLKPSRRRKARRALRKLRRALGPARERRVGIDLLRERSPGMAPATRAALGIVIDRWERDLDTAEQDGASRCRRGAVARVCRTIERAFPDLPAGPVADVRLAGAGRSRVAKRQRRAVRGALGAGEQATGARLHAARVAIKRWRYAIERIEAADPGASDPIRDTLIGLQASLGRVQDLAVLRRAVLSTLAHPDDGGIPDGAAALRPLIEDLEREREASVAEFLRRVAAANLGRRQVLPIRPDRGSASG